MSYYDQVEESRPAMSDMWFEFIITIIMAVVSDDRLSKQDTKDLIQFLSDELKKS